MSNLYVILCFGEYTSNMNFSVFDLFQLICEINMKKIKLIL